MSPAIGQDLIEGCLRQERNAQRMVYELLFPSAMRVCRRYCSSTEEAMEVLNTGFLKVFTQMDKYSGKGSFEGWVHRLMVNTSLDHIRLKNRYLSYHVFPDTINDFPAEDWQEEDLAEVDVETVYALIGGLPPVSKMVFNLFVFEDCPHADIASKLGISIGTSKWHLSNARSILKEKVKAVFQKNVT